MKYKTIDIMREALEARKDSDSGALGDAFELAIRYYISGRKWNKVKRQGAEDIRFSYQGKRCRCEIKSACGEVEDTYDAPFIVYCATVDPAFPAEEQGYVFTNDQWRQFLNGYTGRGQFIRHDSKRGHDHIQSFYVSEEIRPKASKPIAAYIASVLYDMPTVEEFFEGR